MRLWIIVCALSLAFLVYGIVAFLIVGDKGPPAWDFDVVQDTPGKSAYSITADQTTDSEGPSRQHVSGRSVSPEASTQEKLK